MEVEPFGEERADLRMGILAALMANINRDPKKGKPYKPSDFIPRFGPETGKRVSNRRPMTDPKAWEKMKAAMKAGMKRTEPTEATN